MDPFFHGFQVVPHVFVQGHAVDMGPHLLCVVHQDVESRVGGHDFPAVHPEGQTCCFKPFGRPGGQHDVFGRHALLPGDNLRDFFRVGRWIAAGVVESPHHGLPHFGGGAVGVFVEAQARRGIGIEKARKIGGDIRYGSGGKAGGSRCGACQTYQAEPVAAV